MTFRRTPNSNPPSLPSLTTLVFHSAADRRQEAQPLGLLKKRLIMAGYAEAPHPCARASVSSPHLVFSRHVSSCRLFLKDADRSGSRLRMHRIGGLLRDHQLNQKTCQTKRGVVLTGDPHAPYGPSSGGQTKLPDDCEKGVHESTDCRDLGKVCFSTQSF